MVEGSSSAPSLAGILSIFPGIYEDNSGEGMVTTNRSGQAPARRIFIGCGSDVQDRRAASCQTRGGTAGEEAGCVVVANKSAAMQCRAR
jgi:hypothetical protein